MTNPRINTIKSGGSRLYVHPDSDQKVPGVTSVLNMLPKEFLKFWAAKVVAETAVTHAGSWIGMALAGDQQGAVDYLKRAPIRNTSKAAETGTGAHDYFERLAGGETIRKREVHPDLSPFVDHFREFLEVWQPEFLHLEDTVWSDTVGYAGSFDSIFRVTVDGNPLTVIGDWKTTRSGVHEEVALQLTAYAMADYILQPDGTQEPIPNLDGAAVLHVRPEGWRLVPVKISEKFFDVFKALLVVHRWEKELKGSAVGREILPT